MDDVKHTSKYAQNIYNFFKENLGGLQYDINFGREIGSIYECPEKDTDLIKTFSVWIMEHKTTTDAMGMDIGAPDDYEEYEHYLVCIDISSNKVVSVQQETEKEIYDENFGYYQAKVCKTIYGEDILKTTSENLTTPSAVECIENYVANILYDKGLNVDIKNISRFSEEDHENVKAFEVTLQETEEQPTNEARTFYFYIDTKANTLKKVVEYDVYAPKTLYDEDIDADFDNWEIDT